MTHLHGVPDLGLTHHEVYVGRRPLLEILIEPTVSIRKHTPAYVSIRQHTPAYVYVGRRPLLEILLEPTVSIRKHT